MKNLITILGMMGLSNAAFAASISFTCTAQYTLPNGLQSAEYAFTSATEGPNQGTIDTDLPYDHGQANLHVYYDGEYASINFFDKASNTYYNSDSEVAVGKMFSLYVRSPKSEIVKDLMISCTSK